MQEKQEFRKVLAIYLTILGGVGFSMTAWSQEPYVYPAQGQSPSQTAQDKAECQAWATQQTGVDPVAASQVPPQQSGQTQKGGLVRGGAKGAAAGAAIGAVAGDAGKGAAIGAVAGGFGGVARRRTESQRAQEAQAQQAQAPSAAMQSFLRAYSACLTGRGYSVQ